MFEVESQDCNTDLAMNEMRIKAAEINKLIQVAANRMFAMDSTCRFNIDLLSAAGRNVKQSRRVL